MVKKAKSSDKKDKSGRGKAATSEKPEIPKKRKSTLKVSQNAEKKPKTITKAEKESLGPIFAKGVAKVSAAVFQITSRVESHISRLIGTLDVASRFVRWEK